MWYGEEMSAVAKVAGGVYGMAFVQWLIRKNKTLGNFVEDMIDATIAIAIVFVVNEFYPSLFEHQPAFLFAAGIIIGKFYGRVAALFWRRIENADVTIDVAGAHFESKGKENDTN